ncbi:uncharacterized protein LOC143199815 [Rhynchophorus ferrugineus]|uniref:uncharacterized protein LOC143199815 n=1 Tax=Rhynchophorus ferrugineus TaxID=354439 RepID=UPI003FCE878E
MSERRNADVLALNKSEQRKVSKETKKIKKDIAAGKITIGKKQKQRKVKEAKTRGLIYIGHIPHGFFENELKDYFKQFGKVTNVKVCRSRKTGNSKGFGYVEFANPEVAKIAADTMNNYLMFKRRIISEFVPYEKRPKGLFYGKSSTKEHTSVNTRRGKEKYTKNRILDNKTIEQKQKKSLGKFTSKIRRLQELGVQCNLQPVGIESKMLNDIEQVKSVTAREPVSETDDDSDIEFKKPTPKATKSKLAENVSKTRKAIVTENIVLTKSLDSVKKLLSKKKTGKVTEETQTVPKKRKVIKSKSAISKKEKKPVPLNKDTVKKIARELIRKKGNPLINILPSKPIKTSKKK